MTKEDEKWIIEWFRSLYTELPRGRIEKREPNWPDFVLTIDNGSEIGIELTEVIENMDSQRDYSTRNEITDLVLDKLTPLLPFKFALEINLLPEGVKKSDKNKTVEELLTICVQEFIAIENKQLVELTHINEDLSKADSFKWTILMKNNFRNLPKGIKSIEIQRLDDAPNSWNPAGGGLSVPNFTPNHLKQILNKKERKIKSYETCDEYWLVIWEGKLPSGYFNEIKIETPIETNFNKVFIVRTAQQELVILKP